MTTEVGPKWVHNLDPRWPRPIPGGFRLAFRVPGQAVPQGSKDATLNKHTGRVVLFDANMKELRAWRKAVATTAADARNRQLRPVYDGPVAVSINFVLRRPASASKTRLALTKPDIDKLQRAILDAITGVVITNDSRVVDSRVRKRLTRPGEKPHTDVLIEAVQ